jgi:hypothetical protein
MKAYRIIPHTLWGLVLAASPLSARAHHSAAVYEMRSVVALRGTVTRYEWKNPHVYIFVDVEDENGEVAQWALEGEPTTLMARSGWTPTTLAPGDRISARVNRNRNPDSHEARLMTLSKSDGTVLARRPTGSAAATAATDISGVWDALRGYEDFEFVRGALTERGNAAVAAFDEGQSPVQNCLAFPAPMVTFLPYRTQIELAGDRVLIHSEYFDVERVVYMDGRGHPESGGRSDQGHSIGHWDGDALVVDTTLFTDHPIGNFRGLPSSTKKHLVERFEPSEDHTQLRVTFSVEDPAYLLEPWTGELTWDYVPDGEMLPFDCDPEVARRFAVD